MNGIERLVTLGRANMEIGLEMALMRPRFEAYRQRHELGTAPRAVTGFNLFQTPRPVAVEMARLIKEKIKTGCRILEPSVGLGRLYEPLKDDIENWMMVEEQLECCKALKNAIRNAELKHADFLSLNAQDLGGQFDAVIMNPPFKMGTDIKHIRHALEMLKPQGRLVSLCYNGTKQNEILKPLADYWEVLPEKSFKDEGTAASVAMLVIDKAE